MRSLLGLMLIIVLALVAAFALGFINLDARGGKLPTVRADAGALPTVDVKTGSVDFGSRKTTVDVPTMGTKKETVSVPTMSVKKADETK